MAFVSGCGSAFWWRAMAILVVAIAAFLSVNVARGCDLPPTLHISVDSRFDEPTPRNDYSLQEIQAMAAQNQGGSGRQVLGYYRGQFGYSIDIADNEGECPAQTNATVTFRLMHRVIQLGKQVAANNCLLPIALKHYRHIATADEQIVQQYGIAAATALNNARPLLRQIDETGGLRARIGTVVEQAIKSLRDDRRRATQAVNNSDELRQLASACAA
jgi:hypothetical protein